MELAIYLGLSDLMPFVSKGTILTAEVLCPREVGKVPHFSKNISNHAYKVTSFFSYDSHQDSDE